jgi:hypothetical protein
MLVNFSNHSSDFWSDTQMMAAENMFGKVLDFPFPAVDPNADPAEVLDLVKTTAHLLELEFGEVENIHVMGEMTFLYRFVGYMIQKNVRCFASTSERRVIHERGGQKTVEFKFVRFREY